MAKDALILVVDDDPHIREVVQYALEKGGFRVVCANDGKQAISLFYEHSPDLIILDIMMREMDGTDVCRAIRANFDTPIIFLSSKDDEIDKVLGLELGGDDYVVKPFSPRELVARIRAVLRRKADSNITVQGGKTPDRQTIISYGPLKLDLDRHLACWGEIAVEFTVTEFGILRTLLGYPGKVYSRDELMSGAYVHDNHVTDRTIDSHVRRIRRKFSDISADPIDTVHGVGYKLRADIQGNRCSENLD